MRFFDVHLLYLFRKTYAKVPDHHGLKPTKNREIADQGESHKDAYDDNFNRNEGNDYQFHSVS